MVAQYRNGNTIPFLPTFLFLETFNQDAPTISELWVSEKFRLSEFTKGLGALEARSLRKDCSIPLRRRHRTRNVGQETRGSKMGSCLCRIRTQAKVERVLFLVPCEHGRPLWWWTGAPRGLGVDLGYQTSVRSLYFTSPPRKAWVSRWILNLDKRIGEGWSRENH